MSNPLFESAQKLAQKKAAAVARVLAWKKANPEKHRENCRKWANKNREYLLRWRRDNYKKNAEKIRQRSRKWRLENPEKVIKTRQGQSKEKLKEYQKRFREKRMSEKGNNYLALRIRLRMLKAIQRNSKSSSALKLLGCSIELFRLYIQNQFRDGMQWNNYGTRWHIDHIRPCASFDLSKPEEQAKCFHYSNMQPLLVIENLRKGAKYAERII